MSRPPTARRLIRCLAVLALLSAALLVTARTRRDVARAAGFASDVELAASRGAPGREPWVVQEIREAAAVRGVALEFVDVAVRDGRVCVRAEYRTDAWLGPWHRTRKHEKRTSAPCVAGK